MTTVVVGGGLSGLVRARALAACGEPVLLFERSEHPGGVVRSEKRDGYLLELGPNTVRPTAELWALVEELGLVPEALLADPRTPRFVDFGGRLHAIPSSPAGLVGTKLLSARGKLRLLAEPFVRRGDPTRESVRDFFARRLGAEVAERLVEPFVSGIWAGRGDRLAVAQAFPSLARFEALSGSIVRGALAAIRSRPRGRPRGPRGLLSFRAGLSALPQRLAEELGPRAHFGRRVESISRSGDGWKLGVGGEAISADRVCVASPAGEAARLVEPFDPAASAAFRAIPYAPIAVLHVAAPAPAALEGFGHLVAPTPERRILGAVWSSALFPGRAPEGRALFTVFLGGARDPGALDLPDGALVDAVARDFAAVGLPASLEPVRITRHPGAIPQYGFEHAARLEALAEAERRHPGLSLVGSYRGGISVGDVVKSALLVPG